MIARILSQNNTEYQSLNRQPKLIFLPSRKDLSQIGELRHWEREAAKKLGPYTRSSDYKIQNFPSPLEYFREIAVPYVPYFAYGEEIAINNDKGFEIEKPLRILAQIILDSRVQTSKREFLKYVNEAEDAQRNAKYLQSIDMYFKALRICKKEKDF